MIELFLAKHCSNKTRRICVVLFCLWLTIPAPGLAAQSNAGPQATPSLVAAAAEVNREGYLLKPAGLATGEWPTVRLDFSIERADRTNFKNLSIADVQPKLDDRPIATSETDLKLRESQASAVLILLDGSGSMAGYKVDKLRAAKEGLITLIDNLDPKASVGLIVFDEEPRWVIPETPDRELLKREIETLTIRKDKSRFTRLYEAVDFGLQEAKKSQIKNLLLISDGWQDTPETRSSSASELEKFKQEREQGITQFSRKNDIRIFTVAIGDEHGKGLSYVDRAALSNISNGANGGLGAYIELTDALGSEAFQQRYLLGRLQQTLLDLRQSFSYSYSLTLHLDKSIPRDTQEHKLWVGFTVGATPTIQLPVEYTYAFTAEGAPVIKAMKLQPAVFIQSAPATVRWQQLLLIYLVLLSGLLVCALIPSLVRRVMGGGNALRLRKAIVRVSSHSHLVGSVCPNEGTAAGRLYLIKEGDVVLVCPNPKCKTPHHLSCWRFNEHHCMKRTCDLEMIVPCSVLEKYGLAESSLTRTAEN